MSRIGLVTGGTRGIGAAIARALKDEGCQMAVSYQGNHAAAAAFSQDAGIAAFPWDIRDFDACAQGVAAVEDALGGPIDILVNNAGIVWDSSFARMRLEQWRDVLAVNLDSAFNMSRQVFPGMRKRKFGRIVMISSINGQKGQFGQVNYCTAKAGLMGFTRALAQEGAAYGITVNAVAPGYIATEMLAAVPAEVMEAKILPMIPLGRLGTAEEIARCVSFLCAEEAGFITGSTLTANGGQYMAS